MSNTGVHPPWGGVCTPFGGVLKKNFFATRTYPPYLYLTPPPHFPNPRNIPDQQCTNRQKQSNSKNDHWCTNRHMSTQSPPNTQSPRPRQRPPFRNCCPVYLAADRKLTHTKLQMETSSCETSFIPVRVHKHAQWMYDSALFISDKGGGCDCPRCLFVCLLARLLKKNAHEFEWNFACRQVSGHGRTD